MAPDGQYPVFGANGIIGRYHEYNHAEPQLVIGCRGSCGAVNISLPYSWITSNAMVISPKRPDLSLKWLEYFFRGVIDLSGVISGVAQPQITRKSLSPVEISIPSAEEQRKIVAILDEAFEGIDRARANTAANIENSEFLRRSLLLEAFTNRKWKGTIEQATLSEVCSFQGGTQPPKSDFVASPRAGYVRLLQIRDFKSDEKAVYVPDKKTLKKCKDTDTMIGRYGASVGQIHRGKAGAYNVALMKTIPDLERLDADYFYYYLRSDLFQIPLLQKSSRGAQDGFNQADIAKFLVPIPPLKEQMEIAENLSRSFEFIEQAAGNLRSKVNELDHLRQSLLQKAFAGELT